MIDDDQSWVMVSGPGVLFMMRRMEHRQFNAHYHDLAKRAIEAAKTEVEQKEIHERYMGKRRYYLEAFLCKFHDIFVQYFEDALVEIMVARMVSDESSEELTLERVERVRKMARRQSAKRVAEFLASVSEVANVEILITEGERDWIDALGALRNVFVHNDGEPDAQFLERTKDVKYEYRITYGRIELDEKWLLSGIATSDRMVTRFDETIVPAFGLAAHNRFGLIWLR